MFIVVLFPLRRCRPFVFSCVFKLFKINWGNCCLTCRTSI
uniref:Uncharacterized protein n=1 Tax=Rhizophora mucronata TaxID=61149 RepID=A0A2P2KZQ4_RHIMU